MEDAPDLELGSIVEATVYHVAGYGIFLSHGDDEILVLLPDLAKALGRDAIQRIEPGTKYMVRILRRNTDTGRYVGSLE